MTGRCHIGSQGEKMPSISIEQSLLRGLVEARGRKHDIEDLAFRLPLLGTDIDNCDEEVLDIEIFPDRPDLLSAETLFYGIMPFLHNSPPNPILLVHRGIYRMRVSPDL